ncbi:hypothetical protein HAX54_031330 [Datura stramonium]|uniref:Uncharacterized protein n=1 Tax=Datura stramonium TaxID=4076 RepID=A0ABS8V9F9_DATST|nr:hypothetical protein [Datura stramonium]
MEFGWGGGLKIFKPKARLVCCSPLLALALSVDRDKKKRKDNSNDDNDEVGSSKPTEPFQRMEAYFTTMRGLLGGLLRAPHGEGSGEGEEDKTIPGLALRSHMKGVKKIYRTLLLGPKVPQLFPRDTPEYSFLSNGKDEEASDPGDDNDEASSSRGHNGVIGFYLAAVRYSGHLSATADPLWMSTSPVESMLRQDTPYCSETHLAEHRQRYLSLWHRCNDNLIAATVSSQQAFSRCIGTALGSNSTSLATRYSSAAVVPLWKKIICHGDPAACDFE